MITFFYVRRTICPGVFLSHLQSSFYSFYLFIIYVLHQWLRTNSSSTLPHRHLYNPLDNSRAALSFSEPTAAAASFTGISLPQRPWVSMCQPYIKRLTAARTNHRAVRRQQATPLTSVLSLIGSRLCESRTGLGINQSLLGGGKGARYEVIACVGDSRGSSVWILGLEFVVGAAPARAFYWGVHQKKDLTSTEVAELTPSCEVREVIRVIRTCLRCNGISTRVKS